MTRSFVSALSSVCIAVRLCHVAAPVWVQQLTQCATFRVHVRLDATRRANATGGVCGEERISCRIVVWAL